MTMDEAVRTGVLPGFDARRLHPEWNPGWEPGQAALDYRRLEENKHNADYFYRINLFPNAPAPVQQGDFESDFLALMGD